MKWFTTQLLFRSRHPETPGNDWLWEERFVLFCADSEVDARVKAEAYGHSEAHEYIGGSGDLIRWEFERVGELCEIETPKFDDGIEVFSRFLRTEEVESMVKSFEEEESGDM